jgi:excisionase family DNA binding protein
VQETTGSEKTRLTGFGKASKQSQAQPDSSKHDSQKHDSPSQMPRTRRPHMSLVERLRNQTKVLRAAELASLLEVTPQHIYKLASSGRMPSMRVARAIRFDPQQVANWLLKSAPMYEFSERQPVRRVA